LLVLPPYLFFKFIFTIPFIADVFIFVMFIMAITFGIKGNSWAYESDYKNWKSLDDFIKVQKKWGAALAIIVGVAVVPVLLLAGYLGFQAKRIATSYETMLLEPIVESIVSSDKYSTFESGADVAAYLLTKENAPAKNGETLSGEVTPYGASGLQFKYITKEGVDILAFTFYKEKNCSLDKKNCYVYFYDNMFSKGDELVPSAKAYYDDKGKSKMVSLRAKKK